MFESIDLSVAGVPSSARPGTARLTVIARCIFKIDGEVMQVGSAQDALTDDEIREAVIRATIDYQANYCVGRYMRFEEGVLRLYTSREQVGEPIFVRLPSCSASARLVSHTGAMLELPLVRAGLVLLADGATVHTLWRGIAAVRTDELAELTARLTLERAAARVGIASAPTETLLGVTSRRIGLDIGAPFPVRPAGAAERGGLTSHDWTERSPGLPPELVRAESDVTQLPVPKRKAPVTAASPWSEPTMLLAPAALAQPEAPKPPPPFIVLPAVEHTPPVASGTPSAVVVTSPADDLRKQVAERLQAHKPLRGLDLIGADLHDLDFANADLQGIDLNGAKLNGCKLIHARLAGVTLTGADLTGADLSGADMTSTDLSRATLDHAKLDKATLSDARFGGATGKGASFDNARLTGASFKGASLTASSFRQVSASGTNWDKAVVDESVFDGANLERTSWNRASSRKTSLRGCRLRAAIFQKANGNGADLTESDLAEADLRQAIFSGAKLSGAIARGAVAPGVDLTACDAKGVDLSHATLRGSKLAAADLTNAKLDGADLRDSDLERANVSGATRRGTKLSGAKTRGIIDE